MSKNGSILIVEDDVHVRVGLQDRLGCRERLRRQHGLGAVDDLGVRRQLGDLLLRTADALPARLMEVGGETGDHSARLQLLEKMRSRKH